MSDQFKVRLMLQAPQNHSLWDNIPQAKRHKSKNHASNMLESHASNHLHTANL